MIFRWLHERVAFKPWRPVVEAALLGFGFILSRIGKGVRLLWRRLRGAGNPGKIPFSEFKEIVLIRPDRIGDAVLTTPAFRALRQASPKARITVIAGSSAAPLIQSLTSVDAVIPVSGDRFSDWWQARPQLEHLRHLRPDLVIAFQVSWPAAVLSRWLKPARSAGFDVAAAGWFFTDPVDYPFLRKKAHQVTVNLYLLQAIGISVPPADQARLEVPVTDEGRKAIDAWLKEQQIGSGKLIVVHPGSRSRYTQWAPERFAVVADQLAANPGNQVVVLCGPYEEAIVERVTQSAKNKVLVAKGLPLETVIALLERSALFIGNATGTMHLASAVCRQVIAVIGGTHPQDCPERWGPWGKGHRVVHKTPEETIGKSTWNWVGPEGLKFIMPEDVLAAINHE